METAYFRFASKPGADEKRIFNLAQTVVVSISLLLSIVLILLADPFATVLGIPGQGNLVTWLVAIMFIDAIVAIPFARLRLEKKPIAVCHWKAGEHRHSGRPQCLFPESFL